LFAFEEEEDGGPRRPQRSVTEWSPDGRHLFITTSERDRWERGLLRLEVETQQIDTLVVGSDLYSGWRLLGEEGDRLLYQWSDGDLPNEWYVADAELKEARPLTQMNPWIAERTLTRSELVRYRDVDGNELYGILYYPVNYEEGKRYPLVAELYETFFNNGFNANMNMFTNAGWFGFRPSVTLEQGYPGEGWVKGVTTALNDLIERGLVDPERIGVQGGSYGGYATALLITQTNRFAAAINISGKVNMVSFYGDSPRLGVRNITAPERGQDRIGCSLWDCPQRYLAHSAIMHADRIETPLMLITGELDHNVPARQSMEMFYAMRRLEKDVVWVNYANGGHSPANTLDETHDYWERILGWYRKHFGEEEGAGGVAASTDEDGGGGG
jgi:dipeptidyl aminopeptidase/acylaminoacyl peptidase